VSRAQEQAAFLIGERGLTESAQADGRRIVEEAEDVADGIRRGADEYAAGILQALESEALKALTGIRKGIDVLEDRRAELAESPPTEGRDSDADGDVELDQRGDEARDEDAGKRSAVER
jgi:hypothetical protein